MTTELQQNAEPRADMERIVVAMEVGDHTVRKAFKGRWLVSGFIERYFAALGECGGLALWYEPVGGIAQGFNTYDDWNDLISQHAILRTWPDDFVSVIAAELGVDYAVEIDL